ncbi:MAG: hypothetical protein M1840_005933 [Geoglossum simile]|nr:MAG: hypothetical protein M1840_005933 [Geoglossum simile]
MEFYTDVLPHGPLPATPTAFRLVTLQRGSFDSDIEGNLEVADIGVNRNYEALSYAWGDPQNTTSILLDGIRFAATVGLVSALRRLRYEDTSRTLHATRTLVWLGEPDFGIEISGVGDFLTTAAEFSRSMEVPVSGEVSFLWTAYIDGLSAIGNEEDAGHAVRILNRWHESGTKAARFCREYAQDDTLRIKFMDTPLPDRLLSLLLASNGLDTTDPRDHIFALLGLAGSHEELELEPSLVIDYNASPAEVLRNVAVYLLQCTRDPLLFHGAGFTHAQLQLGTPSWVPTWQVKRGDLLANHFGFERPLYRYPEDPIGDISIAEDKNTVTVRGRILCQITTVGRPAETHNSFC